MIINENKINELIKNQEEPETQDVLDILKKTESLERLSLEEVSLLLRVKDKKLTKAILDRAEKLKTDIYGNRIVFFAPLYISNICENNCTYCAFRKDNNIVRNALSMDQISKETELLLDEGHKRVLLVAGESHAKGKSFQYILDAIKQVYSVKKGKSSIRRINVNIAPLEVEEFKKLKETDIGTYQIFQETYHRETYAEAHPSGPKADYDYRLTAIDRAFEAGIDDLGIGVLYGLYDWRFETLALMQHIEHIEKKFGVGPHTISVPRIEPAEGIDFTNNPKHQVSDDDFRLLVAVLRLAVPYTGIILSTRESADLRREILAYGISQISAGSRTNPGGYADDKSLEQFSLGDHRTLDEVVADLAQMGYLPSFCTACYRLGRTGLDFMEYAKPGDIKKKCFPNAMFTFMEFLKDYGSEETKKVGFALIKKEMQELPDELKERIEKGLQQIESGSRDIYV